MVNTKRTGKTNKILKNPRFLVVKGKQKMNTGDTTDLENQIDQLADLLFGLTEEEIKIIENN